MAIEEFNAQRNLARVTAGLKEKGPFYNDLPTVPARTFKDGYPATFVEKMHGGPIKTGPILDVWNSRRANGSMK